MARLLASQGRRRVLALGCALTLAACGSSGGGGGDAIDNNTPPPDPVLPDPIGLRWDNGIWDEDEWQ